MHIDGGDVFAVVEPRVRRGDQVLNPWWQMNTLLGIGKTTTNPYYLLVIL
jgi:hypothetical protein